MLLAFVRTNSYQIYREKKLRENKCKMSFPKYVLYVLLYSLLYLKKTYLKKTYLKKKRIISYNTHLNGDS